MYKYHNEINLIKEIILNEFAYNAYTYKQTKNMLKLISNSNKGLKKLFIKYSDEGLINHLIKMAIVQLKKDNKIIKCNHMRGFYILDDYDPIDRFIDLEIMNSNNKNSYFMDTIYSSYLQNNNLAILPNLKKVCLPTLFIFNPELIKYINTLKKIFKNYYFISNEITNSNLKEFIITLLELDKMNKDYLEFIKDKYSSLFSIELENKKNINLKFNEINLDINCYENIFNNINKINNDIKWSRK